MKNYKNILLATLVLVLVWLIREKINASNYHDRVESNLAAQQSEILTYKLKNGQQVASIKSLQVSKKELKKQLWVKDDSLHLLVKKFKKVKAAVRIKTEVRIDSVLVPFEVPVPFDFKKEFKLSTPDYSFSGEVTQLGVWIRDLRIPNTQRIVIGEKRSYFKTTLTTDVTNSNRYIQTTGISSQVTTVPIKRFGVSVFAGYDIRLQPTIGIGLSYTPFFF
ncbi:hypothetical protein ACFLSU_07990 [Bacteroidota bacterium]